MYPNCSAVLSLSFSIYFTLHYFHYYYKSVSLPKEIFWQMFITIILQSALLYYEFVYAFLIIQ